MEIIKYQLVDSITLECNKIGINVLSNEAYKEKANKGVTEIHFYKLYHKTDVSSLFSLLKKTFLLDKYKGYNITIKFKDDETFTSMKISLKTDYYIGIY